VCVLGLHIIIISIAFSLCYLSLFSVFLCNSFHIKMSSGVLVEHAHLYVKYVRILNPHTHTNENELSYVLFYKPTHSANVESEKGKSEKNNLYKRETKTQM